VTTDESCWEESVSPVVIGVAGGTGSGKTTIVEEIIRVLGDDQVTVIQHDFYYKDRSHVPPSEREKINYDHPDALETALLAQHLHELREGCPVEIPIYDFATHTRKPIIRTVHPRKVIILEGILILVDESLRQLMDIKVFVDTDADTRFIRRLQRDMTERARTMESVIHQYVSTVKPMHLEFVEPSKRYADIIIPEGGYNQVAVDMLITKIKSIIS
jgi:uridine kinase